MARIGVHLRQNTQQGRFSSFPMEESYLIAAAAYVELNPVKAKMVSEAWDYRWSSVHAHI